MFFSVTDLQNSIPVDQIRYSERGLVPAIVQDYLDGTVLMMAWMNQESLTKTLETGETWFWSRSVKNYGIRVLRADIFNWCIVSATTVIVMLF